MDKTCVFFLICIHVGISTCQDVEPTVTFNLDKSSITKLPWMAIITNSSSMVSYGALIHPQAVLTLQSNKITPTVVTTLQVYANCFFQGPRISFDHKQHCSEYQTVSMLNILENHQASNIDKIAILILSRPFVMSQDVGIISLNTGNWIVNSLECGLLSLRTLKSSSGSPVTFFSSNSVIKTSDELSVELSRSIGSISLALDNAMGEESYQEYEYVPVELPFPGSPLVCKSIQSKDLPYVLVGIANLTFKKFMDKRTGVNYFQKFGNVSILKQSQMDMQKLVDKIIKLA